MLKHWGAKAFGCYYWIFILLGGVTNQDVLLTEACYCSRLYGTLFLISVFNRISWLMLAIFSSFSFSSIKNNKHQQIIIYLGYPLEFLNCLDNAQTSFWAVLLPNTNFPTFVMGPLRNLFLLLYLNKRKKEKIQGNLSIKVLKTKPLYKVWI